MGDTPTKKINHKWDEYDKCVRCGIVKHQRTSKLLMAIQGNRDYYKYEQYFVYELPNGTEVTERPNCIKNATDGKSKSN